MTTAQMGLFIGSLFVVYFAGLQIGKVVKLVKGLGNFA